MYSNLNYFSILFLILQISVLYGSLEPDRQYVSNGNPTVNGPQPRLISIGIVDGKAYFTDEEIRIWKEADAFCKSFGMDMGTITTSSQLSFLQSAFNETTFRAGYWLGARDALLPRQFSWEGSGDEVTTLSNMTWHVYVSEPLTCLVYASQPTSSITVRPCAYEGLKTLCEVK